MLSCTLYRLSLSLLDYNEQHTGCIGALAALRWATFWRDEQCPRRTFNEQLHLHWPGTHPVWAARHALWSRYSIANRDSLRLPVEANTLFSRRYDGETRLRTQFVRSTMQGGYNRRRHTDGKQKNRKRTERESGPVVYWQHDRAWRSPVAYRAAVDRVFVFA